MLGEFLLSGPLWPRGPQGMSPSDFSLFSAPQSAGTPGNMQVYGTTATGAPGFWINFNKVQAWRSREDIKCPNASLSSLFPETRAPTKPGARQSANPRHPPISTLPQCWDYRSISTPRIFCGCFGSELKSLCLQSKLSYPVSHLPGVSFYKYKHKGMYLGLFPPFILQNQ